MYKQLHKPGTLYIANYHYYFFNIGEFQTTSVIARAFHLNIFQSKYAQLAFQKK